MVFSTIKSRYLSLLVLLLSLLFVTQKVNAWTGGSGTSADPYGISTCADLQAIGANTSNMAQHYILVST